MNTLPSVICLGEALVDRLGPIGGDPLRDSPVLDRLGGAPANVACGLARLGVNVAFIGRLGDDLIGKQFNQLMLDRGINISGLQIDLNRSSRVVLVSRDITGDRSFKGFIGDKGEQFADQALDIDQLKYDFPKLISHASWLLVGSIPLASPASREALLWSLNEAINLGVKIAFDVNWRPTFWDLKSNPSKGPNDLEIKEIRTLFERASLIKLAKEEANWFFSMDDPAHISFSLPNKPDVVITDGSHLISWHISGISDEMDAFTPETVVDTTGAGDAFMAGLIFKMLSNSLSLNQPKITKDSIRFAAACGALVCTGSGAIDPQPTRIQVDKFLSYVLGGIN